MIKAIEINTSMLFKLVFGNNTMLSCFFYFFLVIELYFLIREVIAHIFNPIAESVIPVGIQNKEVKVEIGTHSVTAEAKVRKCS